MNKDDIVKLIDGDIFYHYKYCDFLYENLQEKDKEIERLNNIINELEKELKEYFNRVGENKKYVDTFYSQAIYNDIEHILDRLKELRESGNK